MSPANTDVLVVGAGPTGLALALQAHTHGAEVRVVERRVDPFRPSRALIVHPRTLEVLRPLGVTDALLAAGNVAPKVRLYVGTRNVSAQLGHFALNDTAFPFLVFHRQASVEAVLTAALAERGVHVERGTDLVDVAVHRSGARATLTTQGRREDIDCRFLAGCDGSSSTVRSRIGIGWRGHPYRSEVVLADLELETALDPDEGHMAISSHGLTFLVALSEQATWRLLATRPATKGSVDPRPRSAIATERHQALLDDAELPAMVTDVAWSSSIPLEHRLATDFRLGPVFLVGDAAHTHSPAGGQGMNTGIQDALNLGWKLAYAAHRAPAEVETLLASYQLERRPVARRVLAATRALFWGEAGTDQVASAMRSLAAPLLAPLVPVVMERARWPVAKGVRILSQLGVDYRRSPLSVEADPRGGGRCAPGRRVPDEDATIDGVQRRLHEALASPGFHVLLAQDARPLSRADLPPSADFEVHRIAGWSGAAVHVIRPDGYCGFRSGRVQLAQLRRWLALAGVG